MAKTKDQQQAEKLQALEMARQLVENGQDIPNDFCRILFPPEKREYELAYLDKKSSEEIISSIIPVPLQEDKIFPPNASIKENEWVNKLIFGENLQILKTLIQMKKDGKLKNGDGTDGVRLIYIDPPFATRQEFKVSGADQIAYADKVSGAEFIEFIRRRLVLANELLAENGSIIVHLDMKKSHYIKVVLDEIMGENRFKNEIVWQSSSSGKTLKNNIAKDTQFLLWYTKSENYVLNEVYTDLSPKTIKMYKRDDNDGRGKYRLYPLQKTDGPTIGTKYDYIDLKGKTWKCPKKGWRMLEQNLRALELDNRLCLEGKSLQEKAYWNERKNEGKIVNNLWIDCHNLQGNNSEICNYPTQKPMSLLDRIIRMLTNENDLVLDFFVGSGTTSAVAEKLKRRWIAIDVGKYAIYITQKRLLGIKNVKPFVLYSGGLYDAEKLNKFSSDDWKLFALQIWGCQSNKKTIKGLLFDGTKDNCLVKVYSPQELKQSGSKISIETISEIDSILGGNAGSEIFIIAPQGQFDFAEDDIEIKNRTYHTLRVPYSMLAKFTENFTPPTQPKDSGSVNEIVDAVGFDFIQPPLVDFEIKDGNLVIKKFQSNSRLKGEQATELSMIFIDYDYNGEIFDIDTVFYNKDLYEKDKDNKSIKLKDKIAIGKIHDKAMFIFVDNAGNERKVVVNG